jgi:hypothetical protein
LIRDLRGLRHSGVNNFQPRGINNFDVLVDSVEAYAHQRPDDITPPFITPNEDVLTFTNQSSVLLEWEVLDFNPDSYVIYLNGTEVASSSWDGNAIHYQFVITGPGTWEVTLSVKDTFSNIANDSIIVRVVGAAGGLPVLLIGVGLVSGVSVVIIIIFYGKRKEWF